MLRLKVTDGNAVGTEIEFEDDFLIGRNAEGDGTLGNDVEISREHARISQSDVGGYVIEDLGSTNGTFVNGQQISTPQPLGNGDEVEVGGTKLVVQMSAPPTPPEPTPAERFAPTRFGSVPAEILERGKAEAPAVEPQPEAPRTEEAEPVEAPPAEAPAPVAEAPAPVAEEPAPAPAAAPEEPEAAPGRLSLRLHVDLAAGEASIEIDGSSERVELVHEDGRWQLKAPR